MSNSILSKFIFVILIFYLSGCSIFTSKKPKPAISWQKHQSIVSQITDWEIDGKIGIRSADNSQSASIKWEQHDQEFKIDVRGPWGQGGFTLSGNGEQSEIIIPEQGQFTGPTPEQILQQHFNWQMPVSNIYWWIRGIPVPNKEYQFILEDNRLKQLTQSNWKISYLRYNSLALPRKIILTDDRIKITLIIYSWNPN